MEGRRAARAALVVAACGLAAACSTRAAPVDVSVAFVNTWRVAGETLSAGDRAIVEQSALDTLRRAFDGFAVRFEAGVERPGRVIRVEDTPYGRLLFGAAGVTYPAARVSSVRFDVLVNEELAAASCASLARCTKTRAEMLDGLGRGIGATGAHELGHQAGLGFARDAPCDECYDSKSSASYVHFFERKHWSDAALAAMRETLPRAAVH